MTTHAKGRRDTGGVAQWPLAGTINDALGLFNRFREGETFRHYVEERMRLVAPMCCLMLFVSVACGAAVVLSLGQMYHSLMLAGLLLLPFVLLGSLFVQAYPFFSWVENRALAHRNHPDANPGMGALPQVPWVLAAAVLLAPLLLLAFVSWKAALALLVLLVAAPFVYALLDK